MEKKRKNIGVFLLILTLVLVVISLEVGKYNVSLTRIIFGQITDSLDYKVFFQLRLPRTLMALYAGFSLALVGAFMQTIFKNPLASPDIMGVSSGASAGAALGIILGGGGFLTVTSGALIGALLAISLAVYLTRGRFSRQLASFVVAGVAVNALAQSILMLMKLLADPENQLSSIEFWLMGGLGNVTLDKVFLGLVGSLPALILLLFLGRQVGIMALSDGEAEALGVNLKVVRPIILFLSALVVASLISITGIISFIGLVAPHLARLWLKTNNRKTWIVAGLIGANLLLISDILARTLTYAEIPVSILTSLIGAPILILLMRGNGKL
ncbi:MAG: iron ABC transporter permease [Clostridium sp.]|nr:iron ABC transporter permease [Clostridium sp.]